jgi:hypothetical protein
MDTSLVLSLDFEIKRTPPELLPLLSQIPDKPYTVKEAP